MEYVFGTQDDIEIVKTKGREHTSLTGFQQVVQEFPDSKITDSFRVVRKLDSTEDAAGNCYDRYEIDRHNRIIDKTGPVAQREAQNRADIDFIAMEAGIELYS